MDDEDKIAHALKVNISPPYLSMPSWTTLGTLVHVRRNLKSSTPYFSFVSLEHLPQPLARLILADGGLRVIPKLIPQ
jgi:hypothetical protein